MKGATLIPTFGNRKAWLSTLKRTISSISKERAGQQETGSESPTSWMRLMIVVVVLLAAPWLWPNRHESQTNPRYVPLLIDGLAFYLEYAATPQALTQGLRGRAGIPDNGGMLFRLPKEQDVTITMDEVNQDLKVITLDRDWRILAIATLKAQAKEPLPLDRCTYVIEIPAIALSDVSLAPGQQIHSHTPPPSWSLATLALGPKPPRLIRP